jgi:hypothetical protein
MRKLFFVGVLATALFGCERDRKGDILPEYKDWYALKAPETQSIQAVYGDIDGTVVIATLFNIYLTSDKGNTWRKANYDSKSNHGLFGFVSVNDTLMVLDGRRTIEGDPIYYGTDPFYFSVDGGENWQYFKKSLKVNLPLNVLKTASGTSYTIKEVLTPKKNSTIDYYVETVGIETSDGRELTLPYKHQIKSIYFDKKQRLYVAASAPVCGTLEKFEYCGDQHGILYISKRPQP